MALTPEQIAQARRLIQASLDRARQDVDDLRVADMILGEIGTGDLEPQPPRPDGNLGAAWGSSTEGIMPAADALGGDASHAVYAYCMFKQKEAREGYPEAYKLWRRAFSGTQEQINAVINRVKEGDREYWMLHFGYPDAYQGPLKGKLG